MNNYEALPTVFKVISCVGSETLLFNCIHGELEVGQHCQPNNNLHLTCLGELNTAAMTLQTFATV